MHTKWHTTLTIALSRDVKGPSLKGWESLKPAKQKLVAAIATGDMETVSLWGRAAEVGQKKRNLFLRLLPIPRIHIYSRIIRCLCVVGDTIGWGCEIGEPHASRLLQEDHVGNAIPRVRIPLQSTVGLWSPWSILPKQTPQGGASRSCYCFYFYFFAAAR